MNQINEQSFATVQDEIEYLEQRLHDARRRALVSEAEPSALKTYTPSTIPEHHFLLLLSDSALPLGSFAFSSGLESYLAHTKPRSSFVSFLPVSISSYASTTLPYVLAAYKEPSRLVELDDTFDATIMCTVGRRASVAQGRALLSIWERAFCQAKPTATEHDLVAILRSFSASLRVTSTTVGELPTASAHLGPLFGMIASMLGLTSQQTAYVFMLSHVKALLSAAVRASMFGPYQAQKLLASTETQKLITTAVAKEWNTDIEHAGQSVPVMDLWIGRHEMLYSRIFNS